MAFCKIIFADNKHIIYDAPVMCDGTHIGFMRIDVPLYEYIEPNRYVIFTDDIKGVGYRSKNIYCFSKIVKYNENIYDLVEMHISKKHNFYKNLTTYI